MECACVHCVAVGAYECLIMISMMNDDNWRKLLSDNACYCWIICQCDSSSSELLLWIGPSVWDNWQAWHSTQESTAVQVTDCSLSDIQNVMQFIRTIISLLIYIMWTISELVKNCQCSLTRTTLLCQRSLPDVHHLSVSNLQQVTWLLVTGVLNTAYEFTSTQKWILRIFFTEKNINIDMNWPQTHDVRVESLKFRPFINSEFLINRVYEKNGISRIFRKYRKLRKY